MTPGSGSPLLLSGLVTFCLVALVFEAGAGGLGPRAVAVLGVLVATNSVLRFVEVAVPGPGGFSPVFLLIILTGYAYGARFGFLMGTLTLAVSAVVTGGVGPWLPYQMLVAGWTGLTAGWLPRWPGSSGTVRRSETLLLAGFAALWGLAFGLVMTLWFWPFMDAGALPTGVAVGVAAGPIRRFLAFYLATSLGWDVFRAIGNALLILAAGAAVLGALRRIGRRFRFEAEEGVVGRADGDSGGEPGETVVSPQAQDPAVHAMRQAAQETSIHPRAWVAWLIATTALVSMTRHPLVLTGVALAIGVVRASLPRDRQPATIPIARFALLVLPLAAGYNFLMAHTGATVLLRLPGSWPLVGGPLTLEALVYGLLTGLSLVVLVAAFATFRLALSARALVRLIPRAFGALTLVGAIALTYVPAVLEQLAAVREAQAVRGHRVRGIRDIVPLAVPLLVGGLERALGLAESMTARGLSPPSSAPLASHLAILGGLVAIAAGWLGPFIGIVSSTTGTAVAAAGLVLIVGTLLALGRRAPFSSYRRVPWRAADTLVALAAWLPLGLAWARPEIRALLAYSPYPAIAPPTADPLLALALLGLVAPALVMRGGRGEGQR